MPTTAGTGAEATKNAVISCYDPPFKKSLRDQRLLPRIALVDPELTIERPAGRHGGQRHGRDHAASGKLPFAEGPADPPGPGGAGLAVGPAGDRPGRAARLRAPARENMAHAALLSGMALANSGLGMAHGVAAALGVHCRTPHGLACAVMLPAALRVNRQVAGRAGPALALLPARHGLSRRASGRSTLIDRIEDALPTG